jgi:hypothetical protein
MGCLKRQVRAPTPPPIEYRLPSFPTYHLLHAIYLLSHFTKFTNILSPSCE